MIELDEEKVDEKTCRIREGLTDTTRVFSDPIHQYLFEEITKLRGVIEEIKDRLQLDEHKQPKRDYVDPF